MIAIKRPLTPIRLSVHFLRFRVFIAGLKDYGLLVRNKVKSQDIRMEGLWCLAKHIFLCFVGKSSGFVPEYLYYN